MTERLPLYVPPTGDAPLDAVEEAIVRMWVDVIVAAIQDGTVALPHVDNEGGPAADRRLVEWPTQRSNGG